MYINYKSLYYVYVINMYIISHNHILYVYIQHDTYIIIIQHDIYILTSLVYCHSDNVYIHVFPLSILILLIVNSKYHIIGINPKDILPVR